MLGLSDKNNRPVEVTYSKDFHLNFEETYEPEDSSLDAVKHNIESSQNANYLLEQSGLNF